MKDLERSQDYFRATVLFFVVFVVLQMATGAVLYGLHIGFSPAEVLEYYRGSEVMLARFPDQPDNFRQPKSAPGLAKIALAHLVAYGVVVFILAHWIRSLGRDLPGAGRRETICLALFTTALVDVLISFPIALGPDWLSSALIYPRPLVFLAFALTTLIACGMLVRLVRKTAAEGGHS